MRDLMKTSIEQAKRAFDSFASTSEKTWKSLETTSQSARVGLTALNTKIAEITRNNAEANFALALKLAESRDINQDNRQARPLEGPAGIVADVMEGFVDRPAPAVADGLEIRIVILEADGEVLLERIAAVDQKIQRRPDRDVGAHGRIE